MVDRAFFEELSEVARAAIRATMADGLTPENKAGDRFDPVTEADRGAERALRAAIQARFPDHGISGEEYGVSRADAPVRWSLDPVDGTRALVCGLPSWAVLVGLLDREEHVAGMIDLPALDERLIAVNGRTLRNGEAVRTSGCERLREARWSTTDPYLFVADERPRIEAIWRRARIARFGLDAMAYARVATGDIDLVVESGLQPHDVDALVAVVRGAGGVIGNWEGGDDLSGGALVAAASQPLYEETVAALAG